MCLVTKLKVITKIGKPWLLLKPWWPSTSPEVRGHLQIGSLNYFHAIRQLIFSRSYCKMQLLLGDHLVYWIHLFIKDIMCLVTKLKVITKIGKPWLLLKPWWPSTSPEVRGHLQIGSLNYFHAIRQLIFSRSYCKMHAWPCSWLLPKPWWPSTSPWSKRTPPTWVLELLSCY